MLRRGSYIGDGNRRQIGTAGRLAAAALLSLALGGCAGLGLPFSPPAPDPTTTGSIPPVPASPEAGIKVDPSDWEAVRATLAGAPPGAVDGLEWLNPATGSTGAITVAAAKTDRAVSCRAFATTINDVHGVRRYSGDVCATPAGRWQIRKIAADDAAIS